ncbi:MULTISPECIES: carboxylating nicotinate-nucleotide diphosphorylase [unclassified Iodidimonas]|jgi:nicotinate-nucleotide pyrophosphorylase (carboxylating)|uniref:carboxylating nicotinate-nucleotide diphosphorylase n=1 Tax=unclassified Iodidimonas TaxID=2626145 RepID=UPI0024827704|nr:MULTISPECIES: carboxylating nicotinate-nucleotide diphosphorylase [unclassified Iodidimonas]
MPNLPFPLSDDARDHFIAAALAEDIGSGDLTSSSVIPNDARLIATMRAREPMILSGLPLACAIFRALDPDVGLQAMADDGTAHQAGSVLLRLDGRARALLSAERTALNLVQHLSGIATLTHRYVEAIKGTGAVILDTRKTTPLLRRLEKYAVACGGGVNHRMGLYDAVMIKDNHIAVAGGIRPALEAARAAGHDDCQVECDTLDQVDEALAAGAGSLLLDNMTPDLLRQAVARIKGRVPTEASGGVRLETVRAIAESGVDRISIGRLTQSAPAIDIGLDFERGTAPRS